MENKIIKNHERVEKYYKEINKYIEYFRERRILFKLKDLTKEQEMILESLYELKTLVEEEEALLMNEYNEALNNAFIIKRLIEDEYFKI